jgi:UDP:flavonoid glycosyltransferase YjiC (YdhE family)
MHITVSSLGSRGDVQPCIALGVGFQRAETTEDSTVYRKDCFG